MLLLKLMVVLLLLRSAHLGAAAACSRVCAAGDGSMMGSPSRESAANAPTPTCVTSHVAGCCVDDRDDETTTDATRASASHRITSTAIYVIYILYPV
jgi:hypothetical protein